MQPTLITARQLATHLGVPLTWVYDRTRQGGPELLPRIRLGKYIRFDPNQIAEYLESRKKPEPSSE